RAQRTPVIFAKQIGLEPARDVGDLEDPGVLGPWLGGEEHGMKTESSRPALHDRRLAAVADLAKSLDRHAGVLGEEIRVDTRPQLSIQQAYPEDLGLLEHQVASELLDVGVGAATEIALHGEADRPRRHVHAPIEFHAPLLALF